MNFDRIPIGRFSQMTQLTQKALRFYDSKGLLVPAAKDAFTGYRCYTYPQIQRGVKIRTLSWLDFGLDEIASLLDAEERGDRELIGEIMRIDLHRTGKRSGDLQRFSRSCSNKRIHWSCLACQYQNLQ